MSRTRAFHPLGACVAIILLAAGAGCSRIVPYPQAPAESYETRSATLTVDGTDHAIELASVDSDFFETTMAQPLLGRLFIEEEYRNASRPGAILHHSFWLDTLDGSPEVVGSEIEIDGTTLTILGVMPEGFDQPAGVTVWVPWVQ